MALTAAQLTRVRLMVNEPTQTPYDDAALIVIADDVSRIPDSAGLPPSDDLYADTYDLYLLAAEIWRLKAGAVSAEFDFEAEGAVFARSQQFAHFTAQSTRYAGMSAYRSTTVSQ